jgi:thiamine biosynthesis lipoprotein
MFQLKYLFLAGVLLYLTACSNTHRDYQDSQEFFGSEIHITLYEVGKATATQAFTTLWKDFEYMHAMWHPWQPGSLGRTNELLAMNREFSVNPSVLPLIDKARPLSSASNYLYNPASGKLAELWGFQRETVPTGPPPVAEQIQSLVAQNPTLNDIELHGIRMKGTNPALKLDFGVLAKGVAMDRAMLTLQQLGIQRVLINAGGDVKVMGNLGDQPWQVTIPDPRGATMLARLRIFDGESVFTSSEYDHYFDYKGKRYHHILDPRTGYPVDDTMLITVIHPDAATAAAATTALFVAGPAEWHAIAKRMNISHVMLIDKQGRVHMTPPMAARIRFSRQPVQIELSPSS